MKGSPRQRLQTLNAAMEFILSLEGETPESVKRRFLDNVIALEKAFSLALPLKDAMNVRDEVAFFQQFV